MIDPKLLRGSLDAVAANLARRGFAFDVQVYAGLEERRKGAQIEADRLRADRNATAKQVGMAKGRGEDVAPLLAHGEQLGQQLVDAEAAISNVQAELEELQLGLPNLLQESVPPGAEESANVEVRRWGTPRSFDFKPRDHVELGESLARGMDFEAGVRIAGSRFVVLRHQIARLHRALGQFMLDLHSREHGYTEVYVPYLASPAALRGTGQLPKFESDLFSVR
ncbi:MAG TPA: serine--tRNA ligase, partial [Steroidobacteraceae bacterium]|nr:serine--tRNA ligase [Steroidobacteraceae bacterium]